MIRAMVSCVQSSRLISEAQDRRLSGLERTALTIHLVTCRGCRTWRRQAAMVDQLVTSMPPIRLGDGTRLAAIERIRLGVRRRLDHLDPSA